MMFVTNSRRCGRLESKKKTQDQQAADPQLTADQPTRDQTPVPQQIRPTDAIKRVRQPADLMALQGTVGNRAVQRVISSTQNKLAPQMQPGQEGESLFSLYQSGDPTVRRAVVPKGPSTLQRYDKTGGKEAPVSPTEAYGRRRRETAGRAASSPPLKSPPPGGTIEGAAPEAEEEVVLGRRLNMPPWANAQVRQYTGARRIPDGDHVRQFGDQVLWTHVARRGRGYRESPGRLCLWDAVYESYQIWNSDMRTLVVQGGMQPSRARGRLAEIDERCFNLLMAALLRLSSTTLPTDFASTVYVAGQQLGAPFGQNPDLAEAVIQGTAASRP